MTASKAPAGSAHPPTCFNVSHGLKVRQGLKMEASGKRRCQAKPHGGQAAVPSWTRFRACSSVRGPRAQWLGVRVTLMAALPRGVGAHHLSLVIAGFVGVVYLEVLIFTKLSNKNKM